MPAAEYPLSANSLVRDAINIWRYGVDAVTPQSLMRRKIQLDGAWLVIDEHCEIDLRNVDRLIIVGAGKASAAMASEFVGQLRSHGPTKLPKICGWVNAPSGSFTTDLPDVHLHAARPAGSNIPTLEAIAGTQQILQLVASAREQDVVVAMISGGGSALLVSPVSGLSLDDKQSVAQCVSAAGGNIVQLNCIRRCISQVKSGGLARACRAGKMISLIISDVLGDPLELIASGPTIVTEPPDYTEALDVLLQLGLDQEMKLGNVIRHLQQGASGGTPKNVQLPQIASMPGRLENIVLGNLADAVDAAGVRAVELGYQYHMQVARQPEGDVSQVAKVAVTALNLLQSQTQIDCWISGGEPTVRLPVSQVGKGGRNQQLVLSVLELISKNPSLAWDRDFAFLSGGTDGEDGPTDAAGAWINQNSLSQSTNLNLNPTDYLQRADAYHYFQGLGGLLVTGATGTNVCDLRIGLIQKKL